MSEEDKQPAQQSQEGEDQETSSPELASAPGPTDPPGPTDSTDPSDPPDSADPPARGVTPDPSPASTELDINPPPVHEGGAPAPQSDHPKQKVELDIEGLRREDPPESETPITPAAPTAKNRRPIAIILVLVTLLLAGLWFGYQHTRKRGTDESPTEAPAKQASAGVDTPSSSACDVHPSYALAPFFVPIPGDERGSEVFLKVTLNFTFSDHVPSDEIGKKSFLLRNTITDILLSKRLVDLRSIEGKMALKREIRNLINLKLTRGTVQTVYFEEFFIL